MDTAHQQQYNSLICGLVADGTWSTLDFLYKFATDTATDALLNLVSASFAATSHGATFTADKGYTGDGTDSYLDTTYVPATASGNMMQNSAEVGIYDLSARTTGDFGTAIGSESANHR